MSEDGKFLWLYLVLCFVCGFSLGLKSYSAHMRGFYISTKSSQYCVKASTDGIDPQLACYARAKEALAVADSLNERIPWHMVKK